MNNKPQPKHNRWKRVTGCYNLCDPKEESAQYLFDLRSGWKAFHPDMTRSIGVSLDYEPCVDDEATALEVAEALVGSVGRYWINTDKRRLPQLIRYLKAWEDVDHADAAKYEVGRLEWEIAVRKRDLLWAVVESEWRAEALEALRESIA